MIVEDDRDIRETLGDVLEQEGYEVELASNGADALAVLHDATADVIVLDLMMPGMDGAEFRTRQLAEPALASIPVVLLSASSSADAMGAHLGAAASFAKPMRLDDFLATIERLVGGPQIGASSEPDC
jgi:DNA-binding response OmpR family regulator